MAQISHRDQLVRGAIKCLQTKGYARTTARDIAAASGANLASIGYHFGSKEALLNEALIRIFEARNRRIGQLALAAEDASLLERLTTIVTAILEMFDAHRPLLVASLEATVESTRSDQLREQMAAHYRDARRDVGDMIRAGFGPSASRLDRHADVFASFLIALFDGLVIQWLLDSNDTPNGEELITSLARTMALALDDADASTQAPSPTRRRPAANRG